MKFIATQKNTRQSPRKVRLVANQVKDLPLTQAIEQLGVIQKKSTLVILKTLKQAIANAVNNHGVAYDQLQLDTIQVEVGPSYRRFQAVSRGRAHSILKRSCHVRVELSTKAEVSKKQVAELNNEKQTENVKAAEVSKKTKTETTAKVTKKQSGTPVAPRQMKRSAKSAEPVRKAVVRNKAGKK